MKKNSQIQKKSACKLLVDEDQFTDIMRKLVDSEPPKREDVKVEKRKPQR